MKYVKLFEESGDYGSEEEAIARCLADELERAVKGETSGECRMDSDQKRLSNGFRKGEIAIMIENSEKPDEWFRGTIKVEIDWEHPYVPHELRGKIIGKSYGV